jgi:hypothetical protein
VVRDEKRQKSLAVLVPYRKVPTPEKLSTGHKVQRRVFAFSAIGVLLRDQPVTQPEGFAPFALQKQAASRQIMQKGGVVEAFLNVLDSNFGDH